MNPAWMANPANPDNQYNSTNQTAETTLEGSAALSDAGLIVIAFFIVAAVLFWRYKSHSV